MLYAVARITLSIFCMRQLNGIQHAPDGGIPSAMNRDLKTETVSFDGEVGEVLNVEVGCTALTGCASVIIKQ